MTQPPQQKPSRGPSRVLTGMDRTARFAEQILMAGAALALVVLTVATAWSVGARYLLNWKTTWSLEVSEYMLIFITFLAAAAVQQQRRHVTSGLLDSLLSARARIIIAAVMSMVVLVTFLLLAGFGIKVTLEHYERGTVIYNVLFVERWIIYIFPTMGLVALVIRLAIDVIENLVIAFGGRKS